MRDFANKNLLEIKKATIYGLKEEDLFGKNLIKNILETKDKEFNLITDSRLLKNFIIYTNETSYKNFDTDSKDYEIFKSKAKLNFAKNIYDIYDSSINIKYDININNKVLDRIKNSF